MTPQHGPASALDAGPVFPAATREDWLAAAGAALKGKPLRSWRTDDGFEMAPLHEGHAGAAPIAGRPGGVPWIVTQRIDHPDPVAANRQALEDLAGGAGGLTLVAKGAATARGFGATLVSQALVEAVLAGVRLDLVRIRIEAAEAAPAVARLVAGCARGQGIDPATLDLAVGYDPVGCAAASGVAPAGWAEAAADLCRDGAGTVLSADGRLFHEAGASEAQEIAAIAAAALLYWRMLDQAGVPIEAARSRIEFVAASSADPFATIAKLRAARLVWARIEEASGLASVPVRLHAESSWRMMTRRDPWTNMLRGGIAAFAAGLGGADSVTVLPFTAAIGLPDAFARRVARNAQHVLIEEANLHRVADPVAGSGSFEALTTALAERAWAIFQDIEARGGMLAALSSGWLQARIADIAASRPAPDIVGTTKFPLAAEDPVAVLDVRPYFMPRPGPGSVVSRRLSEAFEDAPQ